MDLQKNKILTEFQKNILYEFFLLTDKFYLTGGTALSAFYLEHRYSEDLDFFTKDELAFKNLEMIIKKISEKLGKPYTFKINTFYFKHFIIDEKEAGENLTLHFSVDITEQYLKKKNIYGNIIVDPLEEILVNKICAVLGRSETKDLIDLYFIDKEGYDIISYLEYAKEKDGGVEPEIVAYCLNNIKLDFSEDIMIQKLTKQDLIKFRENLIDKLLSHYK